MAPRIRIALTLEGNRVKLTGKEHVGDAVLTRRNTVETIVRIYPDGREGETFDDEPALESLF